MGFLQVPQIMKLMCFGHDYFRNKIGSLSQGHSVPKKYATLSSQDALTHQILEIGGTWAKQNEGRTNRTIVVKLKIIRCYLKYIVPFFPTLTLTESLPE